ncbi:MAG: methyltransferase domain-containing protein [Chloroflexi bacterium]|nr:methyltransferase domain-containing protein [Chloroflexota bacterium]
MAEVVVSRGGWNPDQYDQFKGEREQPFFDLAALVQRDPGMRVVDLGCGDGRLTAWLHRELGAAETVGIDSSDEMLGKSAANAGDGVRFEKMDILEATEQYAGQFDLVFSNAALQWILDHRTLFPKVARLARPGGQIAVQMPYSSVNASHKIAQTVASEEPYRSALGGWLREDPVQFPDFYASLMYEELHCVEQVARLNVYGHILPETRSTVEWLKGSHLTAYLSRLPQDLHATFLADYEARVVGEIGQRAPYFYTFPRIFVWGRLPS